MQLAFADTPVVVQGSKASARLVLALLLLAAGFFVAITLSPLKSGFADAPDRGPGDVALYHAEVERIAAGESYYDAVGNELRQRGYPTRSVFNWRLPVPMGLIAGLPDMRIAQVALCVMSLLLMCLSFGLVADQAGTRTGLFCVILLSGALLPCALDDLFLMSELWAGVLMALSTVLLARDRRGAGVLAGIAALFCRELVAPYCLLCLTVSVWERRNRESLLWCAGLLAYALFFAYHASQVLPRIDAGDVAHSSGWIRFGWPAFLIATTQMNGYLLLLPQWVAAIYLAMVLLGCTAWNPKIGMFVGLTAAGYAVAFSIAGHDFNQYWGSLTAPLFCLAACRAPQAIDHLVREAA